MINYQYQAFDEVPEDSVKASVLEMEVEEGRGSVISVCGVYVILPCDDDRSRHRIHLDKLQFDVSVSYFP
jgi:hypothetical protein